MTTETKRRTTKRRGNGEGSIFQRPNGRWEAVITVGYNGQGKRVRRTVYGWTKKEVQDKLTGLQSKRLDGSLGHASKVTVAEFLANWLENAARPTIRPTTHQNYQLAIVNHVVPHIGGIPLSKLTPLHVQTLYATLERGAASVYTRRLVHAVLHRAFKQAVKWDMLTRNVCEAVGAPRLPKKVVKALDAEQVGRLLAAVAGTRLEAMFMLAITTGMRFGELAGLQWSDVDLEGESLNVRHALIELKNKIFLSEPKTKSSRRRIELSAEDVAALHEHRKRMLAEGLARSPFVFCNVIGGPLRRSDFRRSQFKPALKRAGLEDCRFHDLRHSHATLLLSQGTHAKIVQERLGHSNIAMTMDIYSHVLPTMQKEAARTLGRIVAAATLPKASKAATA